MTEHAVGQTMLNLNTQILGDVPVALPSVIEQRKIAEAVAGVEDSLRANRQQAEVAQELKDALMNVLLTGQVRVKPVKPDEEAA